MNLEVVPACCSNGGCNGCKPIDHAKTALEHAGYSEEYRIYRFKTITSLYGNNEKEIIVISENKSGNITAAGLMLPADETGMPPDDVISTCYRLWTAGLFPEMHNERTVGREYCIFRIPEKTAPKDVSEIVSILSGKADFEN